MSTEENKALMRRIIEEVFNKKNLALADELVDTNFVHHGTGGVELKGPGGFKQFATTMLTAFPDIRLTIEDVIAEGDKVASRVTSRGTHTGNFGDIAPTGKQMAMTGVAITRFAGGKVVEGWLVNDELGMMQQLGVIPKK